jgi:hypothetical protein
MPKYKRKQKKPKLPIVKKPFIEIDIEVDGIQGLIEFFLGLNKYMDVSELLKKAYDSSSDLQRLVRYGMDIQIQIRL